MTTYAAIHGRIKPPLDNKWGRNNKQPAQELHHTQPEQELHHSHLAEDPSAIDVKDIELKNDPVEATTSIEFLLITLTQKMRLKPSQVSGIIKINRPWLYCRTRTNS